MTLGGAFLMGPGSFQIGSFTAAKQRVAHAVEPLDCPGLHITVTLSTDIFDTGRNGAAHEPTTEYVHDPLLRAIGNMAVARFVSERLPRMRLKCSRPQFDRCDRSGLGDVKRMSCVVALINTWRVMQLNTHSKSNPSNSHRRTP